MPASPFGRQSSQCPWLKRKPAVQCHPRFPAQTPPMSRPSQPLRLALALALILGLAMLLLTVLRATDAALSVWDRLQTWPWGVRLAVIVIFVLLLASALWAIWRLLRPSRPRPVKVVTLDRNDIQRRAEALGDAAPEAHQARGELEELDRRRSEGAVHACLFGQISTGKSALLHALAPETAPHIGVTGGTTTRIQHHRGQLPDGRRLDLADVPGSAEADDTDHIALAQAEAARSHALIYVVDSDLTRRQAGELDALARFGRPILIALNKSDRFDRAELQALQQRLRQHASTWQAQVIAVSAGFDEEIEREHPDGRREIVQRHVPPRIEALQRALERIASLGPEALEPGREAALLAHVDEQLSEGERRIRTERSQKAIDTYTRRAVIGALAAVAPGTDLVIQGALATALTRELCRIHGLSVSDVDIDDLLARAGGLLRTSTSITLAVVGNALKAFPGFGTLSGGLVHAVAYGLIFDSLGHALSDTLANTNRLDREATLGAFRERLSAPSAERLAAWARLALGSRNSNDSPENREP